MFPALLAQISVIVVGSFIGAYFLRAAADWIVKQDIPFGQAFGTTFISAGINGFIGFIAGVAVASGALPYQPPPQPSLALQLSLGAVGFFITSFVVAYRHELTLPKALLVTLVMASLAVVIVGGLAFVFTRMFLA